MKNKLKILLFVLLSIFLVSCEKDLSMDKLEEKMAEQINDLESYKLDAQMEIKKNDGSIVYDVTTYYLKPDFYKVILKNKEDNNIQAIVKNETGTYVISPTLNKSFKFKSDWPINSSNGFVLQSIIKDMMNDQDKVLTIEDDSYVIENKIRHNTNSKWESQKVIVNKKTLLPTNVLIQDSNKNVVVSILFKNIDLSTSLKKTDFDVDNTNDVLKLELGEGEVVFEDRKLKEPTYLPEQAELKNKLEEEDTSILYYEGNDIFTIVQEFIEPSEVLSSNRIYGDVVFLDKTIAALTTNSLTWYYNGIEYSIISQTLSQEEMIKIANSFNQV